MKLSYISLFISLCCCPVYADEYQDEIAAIKKQLAELQKRLAKLEGKNQDAPKAKNSAKLTPEQVAPKAVNEKGDIKVYASLRPTYGYAEQADDGFWDIQDALSNAGFKSTYSFIPGWSAIAHGEWSVDLGNNGDFGKARQVYVALSSPYGQIGLGKQRPAQYTLIAEYVDLFNHRSSPFAFDMESPFFVNNMVTYQKQFDRVKFMLGAQFDGEHNQDGADFINTGLGYSNNGLHMSVTYSSKDVFDDKNVKLGNTDVLAAMIAKDFTANLYGAMAYQDVDYNHVMSRSGSTFDVSLGYRFHPSYRAKLGYFDFDDGQLNLESLSHNGGNITLEWLPSDNLRFHLEYLTKSFDILPNFYSVSMGFRYDYSQIWSY